jgi:ketosteroid isomerase-like protein
MDADEVMTAYAAAWERGDPQGAWEFYAENVVMRLPGRGSLAGTHSGRAAVITAIQALLARTSDLAAEVEVLDRFVSADRVALLVREAVSRGHERLELRRVALYRVRGDRIVDIDIFEADQYEVDEFFG